MNLRKAAEGKSCILCGAEDGTVVLAHLRVGLNGGLGKKPPDHHGIEACFSCHSYIDGEGRSDHKLQLIGYLKQIDRWLAEKRLVLT